MARIDDATLKEIHGSLSLAAERLSASAAMMATSAVPVLGTPPSAASAKAAPMAQLFSRHAAPMAHSAPVVAQAVPMLAPVRR